jgi:multidrug efflux pump subunit AcrA (membrane-fusion protein)
MPYDDLVRHARTPDTAISAAGPVLSMTFRRPAIILGWGLGTVGAYTPAGGVGGTVRLRHSAQGAAFVDVDTMTLPAVVHVLGRVFERSELLRGQSPAAPEATLTALLVRAGDVVQIDVSVAQTVGAGGTLGSYQPYMLVAPRGSL